MEVSSNPAKSPNDNPVILFKRAPSRLKGNLSKRRRVVAHESDQSSEEDDGPEQDSRLTRKLHPKGIVSSSSNDRTSPNDQTSKEPSITTAQADRHNPLTDTNDATKQSTLPDDEKKKFGPKRSANVRYTTVTDYATDVCKDYKITGFCGFGDGCRYAHDRANVKQGWQLDREWETITKGRRNIGGTVVAAANRSAVDEENASEDDESPSMDIPRTCGLCDGEYKSPVSTKCGHVFCEECALKRYRKDPTCGTCGSATNGVFNSASRLVKRLATQDG
ncbi:hypothetical protein GGI42DRAFT_320817 [Trichoderma sp. SZMC 28013]